jgi:hypothetical protein
VKRGKAPSPLWGGDDRGAVRGGEAGGQIAGAELDPPFPTLLACGELSLPMKGREAYSGRFTVVGSSAPGIPGGGP